MRDVFLLFLIFSSLNMGSKEWILMLTCEMSYVDSKMQNCPKSFSSKKWKMIYDPKGTDHWIRFINHLFWFVESQKTFHAFLLPWLLLHVWIVALSFLKYYVIIFLGSGLTHSGLKMFGCSTPKTCAELKGSYLIQTSGTAYYSSSKISLQTKLRFYWASFKMPIM